MPGVLHHRKLHAQADPQVGHLVHTRKFNGLDLSFHTALAKAAGHQNGVETLKQCGALLLDRLGVDVLDLHLGAGVQARMVQGLSE